MGRHVTVRRQLLWGYLVPLLATLGVVLVAVAALQSVATAKNTVIQRDADLVIDSHRLTSEINASGTGSRAFLLTRNPRYLAESQEAIERADGILLGLEDKVHTDEGRRLVARIRTSRDRWRSEVEALVEQARRPGSTAEELGVLLQSGAAPALEALNDDLAAFRQREQALIDQGIRESDAAARNATRLVWLLGTLALLGSLGIGLWLANRISRQLTRLALDVDAAAAQVLAGTSQQVAGSAQQAVAVQETVSTIEELVQTAQQSAERARTVAEQAQRAAEISRDGTRAVADTAAGMEAIREQVTSSAQTVVELAERARSISAIVSAVEEIAGQTHLLALNAAIEAARAGEHGRGFSVVAGEVRSLAEQSRRATAQVAQILTEIQQGTASALLASEEGTKRVTAGVSSAEQAGGTIHELAESIAAAAEAGEQIAASSTQQAVVTSQIGEAMRSIEDVMEQSGTVARDAEQSARDLHRVAAELKQLVGAAADGR